MNSQELFPILTYTRYNGVTDIKNKTNGFGGPLVDLRELILEAVIPNSVSFAGIKLGQYESRVIFFHMRQIYSPAILITILSKSNRKMFQAF